MENKMNSHITITETSNVNWDSKKVIDGKKIEKRVIPWENSVEVKIGLDGEKKTIKMKKISLYENILLLDNKEYTILHILSKREESTVSV